MSVIEAPVRIDPNPHRKLHVLIAAAQKHAPARTAVAHPCDSSSLEGVMEAASLGLIDPILVGPEARIRAVASEAKLDLGQTQIVEAEHSHDAAAKAVALIREGRAEVLMKGSLHTDEIMGAVVARETGLRTSRRISHCFIMDVPGHEQPLDQFITGSAGRMGI